VDVLADDFVAVGAEEIYESALVGVFGVYAGVSTGAYEVAAGPGVL
jgi:hypothetical protein